MLIGELARRAGTTTRALRYYEEQGLLQPGRSGNGYRAYDEETVVAVQQIRGLLDAGFGSAVIAQLLPCARGSRPEIELCPDVVAAMQGTLQAIDARIEKLHDHRAAVSSLLGSPLSAPPSAPGPDRTRL